MSRGINRERQVKAVLLEQGWWVTRAAGSLGDADLVALMAGETPQMIEVKSTIHPFDHFGPQDREELYLAAVKAGAVALLAWWPKNGKLRWIPANEWPKRKGSP